MILLDTHVLLWLRQGSPKLGKTAIQLIDENFKKNTLAVSAISFWEISLLQIKGRIQLSQELVSWRNNVLDDGIHEFPINGATGIYSNQLIDFHQDPADRLIVATALLNKAILLTADSKILEWGPDKNFINAAV